MEYCAFLLFKRYLKKKDEQIHKLGLGVTISSHNHLASGPAH